MRFASLSLHLGLVGLCAAAGVQVMNDVNALAESMPTDPNGFQHIGDDGVMRSFNEAGQVMGYARVNRDGLLGFIADRKSILTPEEKAHLTELWSAVDSSQVNTEQIWQPSKELLPAVLKQQLVDKSPVKPSAGLQKRRPLYCKRFSCRYNTDCKTVGCLTCTHVGRLEVGSCT
ncbi:hypothetical protein GX50_00593 [[Emmonsia] crescens]|uniref:Uncharacterized protein n=1 Tax=[Emmonsia] crescens TaxID=73230 RepID=A0A2B7ZRB0_9EURO|nr:hypothetical protein GX50_00593 [Emmonsia crescens]